MLWVLGLVVAFLLLGLVWVGWKVTTALDQYIDSAGVRRSFKDDEPYDTPGRPGSADFPTRDRS